jgi:hypothetical protein
MKQSRDSSRKDLARKLLYLALAISAILSGGAYYQPRGSIWYFPQAYRLDKHQKFLLMSPGGIAAARSDFAVWWMLRDPSPCLGTARKIFDC